MRSQYLLVQIQQWKHHKIFETCSKLTTSNASEQVDAGWVGFSIFWIFQLTSRYMSYFLNAFLTALNVDQYSATLLRLSSNDFTWRAECFCYTLIGQKGQLNCSTNLQSFIELGSISICTVASSTNHKPNYATYQQSSFVVFHHFIASLWCLERENCSYIFVVIFFFIVLEVIKSEQQKADAVNTPKTKYKNQPKSCL